MYDTNAKHDGEEKGRSKGLNKRKMTREKALKARYETRFGERHSYMYT